MSNSKLVDVTMISPNSTARTAKIDTITIHHMACKATAEACGASFLPTSRKASSNYGIGYDGKVGLYVPEDRRSWCSSSYENDNRAITIEVSNDGRGPDWHVPDVALNKLIDLCVDICQRNNIKKLNFTGDTTGNLTMHKWFQNTVCPGPYLESKFPYIAQEVNKRLSAGGTGSATTDTGKTESAASGATGGVLYRVQVGAFSRKDFAEAHLKKVKAAGFPDAFIAVVDCKLYRVQIGSFSDKANAESQLAKVIKAGYNGFITKNSGKVAADPEDKNEIKAGSLVRVKAGARDYTGGSLADFVYERNHRVKSISGNRVVISYNEIIVAAIHKDNLIIL